MKLIVEIPQDRVEALTSYVTAQGGHVRPHRKEIVETPEGDDVYRNDVEHFYRRNLPDDEYVEELLAAGWTLKPWDEVTDDEAGALGGLVNFYSEGDLYLSPEWHQSFVSLEQARETLQDLGILIPPEGDGE